MTITPEKQKILDNIGLIALDLDRTTLTRAGLTARTKECLEEAIKRGYQVVIATGRPFVALPESLYKVRGLRYVIISNGAHIADLSTGEFIFSDYISHEASRWCLEYTKSLGYHIEVFTEGKAFTDRERYDNCRANIGKKPGARYVARTRKPVDDTWQFWEEHIDKVENVNIIFETQEDKKRVREYLESMEHIGFTVTSSMTYNLEIGGEHTSKANALKELSDYTGIPLDRVIAFGDSPNDLAMIRESGFGVAMGNALPEVKEDADYITLSNEDEGVCYAIRLLLFKEKNGVPKKKRRFFDIFRREKKQ